MLDIHPSSLSIFDGLDHSQINQILPLLETCVFPENVLIFKQEEQADFLYILTQGEVIVRYKPYDGSELTIGHVCPDGVFGWSAALGRSTYSSSAYCLSPCKAVRIRADRLKSFCERNAQLGMILLEWLASGIALRLRSTHDEILNLLTNGLVIQPDK